MIFKPKSLKILLKNASITYSINYSRESNEILEKDRDFTHYSLQVNQIKLKPCLLHAFSGKEFVKQAHISGVRGDLDKRWLIRRQLMN